MVIKKTTFKRHAFTIIELIFAIIIISIAVVSLPVMTKITEKGLEESIYQEAIFASSAEIMGVSSGYWDTRSIEDIAYSHLSRVIDINVTNAAIRCDSNRLRPGHIAQPLHRRCLDSNTTTGLETAGVDTIAAAVNTVDGANIFKTSSGLLIGEAVGYKDIYTSDMNITRVGNIKYITVTVKDGATQITRLRMQSANIGEIDYFKRRF